jgi:hypothetical protein
VSGLVVIASLVVTREPASLAEQQPDQCQRLVHPHGLTTIVSDHAREALTEDALRTQAVLAAEAAGAQMESDGNAMPGEVGHCSGVVTMDS